MPAQIRVIRAREFLVTTAEGQLDYDASLSLLAALANAEKPGGGFDVLLDLRRSQWRLSVGEVYQMASDLAAQADLRRAKIALLILPEGDLETARFLETCSVNRGLRVDTFTNFEDAIQWFYRNADDSTEPNAENPS